MERKAANQKAEHSRAIEAAYRRGYHHGLSQAIDLISGLLTSGMPSSAAADLCHVFEQQVIIPWRSAEAEGSASTPAISRPSTGTTSPCGVPEVCMACELR